METQICLWLKLFNFTSKQYDWFHQSIALSPREIVQILDLFKSASKLLEHHILPSFFTNANHSLSFQRINPSLSSISIQLVSHQLVHQDFQFHVYIYGICIPVPQSQSIFQKKYKQVAYGSMANVHIVFPKLTVPLPKLTVFAPENSPKGTYIVFQPSTFRSANR